MHLNPQLYDSAFCVRRPYAEFQGIILKNVRLLHALLLLLHYLHTTTCNTTDLGKGTIRSRSILSPSCSPLLGKNIS